MTGLEGPAALEAAGPFSPFLAERAGIWYNGSAVLSPSRKWEGGEFHGRSEELLLVRRRGRDLVLRLPMARQAAQRTVNMGNPGELALPGVSFSMDEVKFSCLL